MAPILSEGIQRGNAIVEVHPDQPWELIEAFTTLHGSWETDGRPYGMEPGPRSRYLKPWSAPDRFDEGGADHHLFARLLDVAGNPVDGWVLFDSDGADGWNGAVERRTGEKKSLWTPAIAMVGNSGESRGSTYDPDRKERGPWRIMPQEGGDVLIGAGLPNNQHVSWFGVWQLREFVAPGPPVPVPGPEPVPPVDMVFVAGELRGIRQATRRIALALGLEE